jgi:hypothetical protein
MNILRALDRLAEAIAAKRDPWPAFYALKGILDHWAIRDPEFLKDMEEAIRERSDNAQRQHGIEYAWQAVSFYTRPYVGLMERMGFFKELNVPPNKLNDMRRSGGA